MTIPAPLQLPFPVFRLILPGNLVALQPALDWNTVQVGVEVSQLLEGFRTSLSTYLAREPDFLDLLSAFSPAPWSKSILELALPGPHSAGEKKPLTLTLPFFWQEHPAGCLGLIPWLGLEGVAPNRQQLQEHLQHLVVLEFTRRDQVITWEDLISTLWFADQVLVPEHIPLELPGVWQPSSSADHSQHPWLDRIGERRQLSRQEHYGRQEILTKLVNLITQSRSRSILLVGPPQVGKTTLIWEAVRQLALEGQQLEVWETSASQMIKELSQEKGWEYNLPDLCKEIQVSTRFLLLHNLARLFEVGQYQNNPTSMAEFLLPLLSAGQLGLITECTPEEYARMELRAPQFLQAFHVLQLPEPTEELNSILLARVNATANLVGCPISPAAIEEALRLHRRFLPYAGLPGRPIRFLESILQQRSPQPSEASPPLISRQEIIHSFCDESGLPAFLIDPAISFDPAKAHAFFQQQVFGQQEAISALVSVLARVKADLMRSGKPIASFLFVGPTGVGKTELAKSLAQYVFGHANRMLRFDMSEFSNPYAVARLIGADGSEGLLTTAVRGAPFCLVLFDEIEKANPSFFDLLLQILDEGRITDSQGRVANFCSAIIIMTSNLGAQDRIIWPGHDNAASTVHQIERAIQKEFRPELLNRIDQVLYFNRLDAGLMRQIVEREFALLQKREGLKNRKVQYHINPQALDELTSLGYSHEYGARHLQRTLREKITLPLAETLNQFDPSEHFTVILEVVDGAFQLQVNTTSADLEELMADRLLQSFADYCGQLRQMGDLFLEGYSCTQLQQALQLATKNAYFPGSLPDLVTRAYYDLVAQVQTIAAYEEELCLQGIKLGTQDPLPHPQTFLDDWETAFFERKRTILFWANPEANCCYLHLYGPAAPVMLTFYQALSQRRSFQAAVTSVWLPVPASPAKESYRFLPWPVDNPTAQGKLLGLVVKVDGPGASWYFHSENGGQKWWDPAAKVELRGLVQVKTRLDFSPLAHRADFLQGANYRRWVREQGFKDSLWGVDRNGINAWVEQSDQILSTHLAQWIAKED